MTKPSRFIVQTWAAALLIVLLGLVLTACYTSPPAAGNSASGALSPTPVSPVPSARLTIYAPASPSSVPVVLAAQQLPNANVTIFTNHSQANTLFLRGDADILVTGLSVGVSMFENGAPVQVVNSFVTDLTYLVTYGQPTERFADLAGQEIYLPFEGSPTEEITRFLAEQDGLVWGEDIKPVYSPFPASVELLRQGKAKAVVLPEPFVSMVQGDEQIFVSLNYRQAWETQTGGNSGYPQVGVFVNRDWAAQHAADIESFNRALAHAIQAVQQDPVGAIEKTGSAFGFPQPVMLGALQRTGFAPLTDEALANNVQQYYQTIGEPLDAGFKAFFYRNR
jgi:NitT/TauT family transport system substrate-binding protein